MNQLNHTPKLTCSRNRRSRLLVGFLIVLLFSSGAYARPLKWEYRVLNAGVNNRLLENLLNSSGLEGWELVQINAKGVAIFKRQKVK